MKIGINLLLFGMDFTLEALRLIFEKVKKAGYHGVEFPLIVQHEPAYYAAVRGLLNEFGLECTTLTVATAEADPISPDAAVRDRAFHALKWKFAASAVLGSTVLGGPLHSALGVFPEATAWPSPAEMATLRTRAAGELRRAAEFAADYGVVLAVEYLNHFECYLVTTADDLAALVAAINHPNCRMMYDTHHAHIEEDNVYRTLTTHAPKIVHVHVSENHRGVPGTGQVDWHMTFKALKESGYRGWLVIESFDTAIPELIAATKMARKRFDSPDDVLTQGIACIKKHWG